MSARGSADERKHSVTVAGHRTSVSLEDEFWQALCDIAGERGISASSLIAEIDESRGPRGLSSAIRVHVLAYFRGRRDPGQT